MADQSVKALGRRIRGFRNDKGLTATELARAAKISKSYLSELENGTGNHKRPSADTLYRIGKALGISMSELLGKPFITAPANEPPPGLKEFAAATRLPDADVQMLAGIRFRGDPPRSPERWAFIYHAIRSSASMDEDSRPRYRSSSRRKRSS
jgi:transcriptional regulator with XRE-family HTH domain